MRERGDSSLGLIRIEEIKGPVKVVITDPPPS